MRRCAVSIDLDPVPCYYRIHALAPPPPELRTVIMDRALPRFAELFAARGIHATFFVVGEDLDPAVVGAPARAAAELLGELARAGHELGNHSYSHPYQLARLGAAEVAREIGRCEELLRAITGRRVAGFRAPGYDLSTVMIAELMRRGYVYDSSLFPAPGYYLAKAAVMAALAVLQRPSGAVMTNPRALIAPPEPYRPSPTSPWRHGQAPLVELPIGVTPWLRVPAIGTTLLVAPAWVRKHVMRAMRGRSFFNLELHGIDLVDAEADGIPGELVARQPDLRVPLAAKVAALDDILAAAQADWEVTPLAQVAAWAQREAA